MDLLINLYAWFLKQAEHIAYFIYKLFPRKWQTIIEKHQEFYSILILFLTAALFSCLLFLFSHVYVKNEMDQCLREGGRWHSEKQKCLPKVKDFEPISQM